MDKYDGFINRKTLSTAKEVEEVEVRASLKQQTIDNCEEVNCEEDND